MVDFCATEIIMCDDERQMADTVRMIRGMRICRISRHGRRGNRFYTMKPRPRAEWKIGARWLIDIMRSVPVVESRTINTP